MFRNVVDGDTWFFVKPIADEGSLGFSKHNLGTVKIYAVIRSGSGKKYYTTTSVNVALEFQQVRELIEGLKECHRKALLVTHKDWGKEGTYIQKSIETDGGTIVDITSYSEGQVGFSILHTDKRGAYYMHAATEVQFKLSINGYNEVVTYLEKEYAKITDADKIMALECQLARQQEKALIFKPPMPNVDEKWYIYPKKCLSMLC